jgi:hypothetical protein
VFLAGTLVKLLSRRFREFVTDPVRKPRGVKRWVDITASADVVSNGPTRVRDEAERQHVPVWNEGSVFRDHTTYWRNLDGFVLRVARLCGEAAGSAWVATLPAGTSRIARRAVWRLEFLRLARVCTALGWLLVLPVLWAWEGHRSLMETPDWLPEGGVALFRMAMLPAGVALAAWVHFGAQTLLWRQWVRREQYQILQHAAPAANHEYFIAGVFGVLLLAPLLVLRHMVLDALPPEAFRPLQSLKDVAFTIVTVTAVVTMLWVWCKRPPAWDARG